MPKRLPLNAVVCLPAASAAKRQAFSILRRIIQRLQVSLPSFRFLILKDSTLSIVWAILNILHGLSWGLDVLLAALLEFIMPIILSSFGLSLSHGSMRGSLEASPCHYSVWSAQPIFLLAESHLIWTLFTLGSRLVLIRYYPRVPCLRGLHSMN